MPNDSASRTERDFGFIRTGSISLPKDTCEHHNSRREYDDACHALDDLYDLLIPMLCIFDEYRRQREPPDDRACEQSADKDGGHELHAGDRADAAEYDGESQYLDRISDRQEKRAGKILEVLARKQPILCFGIMHLVKGRDAEIEQDDSPEKTDLMLPVQHEPRDRAQAENDHAAVKSVRCDTAERGTHSPLEAPGNCAFNSEE